MKKMIAACLTVAAVGACATEGADQIFSYSEATQSQTLQQCHGALGVQAPLTTDTLQFNDGRVSVFAVNANGVSLAQARSINRCMQDSLLANPPSEDVTYEVVPPAAEPAHRPVTAQQYVGKAGHVGRTFHDVPGCTDGSTRLYRGTLYCASGRPLQ